jgi:hypothetical protein
MLHITNGDSAANRIRALDLGGDVLPWRDVLHEGPVPAPATLDSLRPLRARFLSDDTNSNAVEIAQDLEARDRRLGAAADEDELTLWFEHDLYDQLQLLQILDYLAGRKGPPYTARVTLAQSDDYLGLMDVVRLRSLWERRADVTQGQLQIAQRVWAAFSAPDPQGIQPVAETVTVLPHIRRALLRHLEEFPAVETGLSRTERQILETLVVGSWPLEELFTAAHHDREDPFFLGDTTFFATLRTLAAGDSPLVAADDERAWLTDMGREVLGGRSDRVEMLGIDRWLGGVHLKGRRVPFRWNSSSRRIVTS